jgi:Mg-chelatase subunit ChlD
VARAEIPLVKSCNAGRVAKATGIAICAAFGAAVLAATLGAQTTRKVFVTVADENGQIVTGLKAADFTVEEVGKTHPVLRVTPSAPPMLVAILVDTSAAAEHSIPHMRTALTAFVNEIPQAHDIMLVSMGRQGRIRVPPTDDRKKIRDAVAGLFQDGGSTALLDSVREAFDRYLRQVENPHPVYVLVTTDGPEASATHEDLYNSLVQELRARAIVINAVVLKTRSSMVPNPIALTLTELTRGRYDAIAAATGMADKLKALARNLFMRQYELEYSSEAPDSDVNVSVARERVYISVSSSPMR